MTPVRNKELKFREYATRFSKDDLAPFTNSMIDTMLEIIADATDADVVFQPVDEEAYDGYAEDEGEKNMGWTLGHIVVHATASSEEGAFLAAELARGVEPHGRSRYETHWTEMKTIEQCRQRLEESRRMRLASLETWPDEPKLDNMDIPWERLGEVNAVGRFLLGLTHDDSHLDHLRDVVAQAKNARTENQLHF